MKNNVYFKIKVVLLQTCVVCCLASCSNNITPSILEKSIKENVMLEDKNIGGLKESELLDILEEYASKINKEAKDAALDGETWILAEKEQVGKKINIQKTLEILMKSKEGEKVKLVTEEVKPKVTSQMLKSKCTTISTFTTPILNKESSRVNNIEIAANKLDWVKLKPGEEFSFNKKLGRRTEAKGYEDAPIIIKTEDGYEKGFGVGGGICQLSSTLYNAVEKAGMEVTERHIHSKNVGYIPLGKDATVSFGAVDFKFRNTKKNPVMIRTYLEKNSLTVKIVENANNL